MKKFNEWFGNRDKDSLDVEQKADAVIAEIERDLHDLVRQAVNNGDRASNFTLQKMLSNPQVFKQEIVRLASSVVKKAGYGSFLSKAAEFATMGVVGNNPGENNPIIQKVIARSSELMDYLSHVYQQAQNKDRPTIVNHGGDRDAGSAASRMRTQLGSD